MKLDAVVSEPQYLNHLLPIWHAIPDSLRGQLHITSRLTKRCVDEGLNFTTTRLSRSDNPVLAASYGDYRYAASRPIIFVEHGAGQTYPEHPDNPAYSGGAGRERVILFICPSQTVADRNLARYPDTPAAVVGCPALDRYHLLPPAPTLTIAITFHADLRLAPESASAFREFHAALPLLLDAGYSLLGHGHPRIFRRIKPFYDRLGIPSTDDLSVVFDDARLLIADNTSAAFEFASLGRPIVWMSPSFYRRDLHAWPRFWGALCLGPEARTPLELPDAVRRALAPPTHPTRLVRDNFISTVYAYRDGKASQRAVEAIISVVEEKRWLR